jgi:hypothetical protein
MALDEFSIMPFGDGKPRWFKGTATPTAGTFNTGDIIFNSSPTGVGPSHWLCSAGGTTGGTWIADALTTQAAAAPNDGVTVYAVGDIVWNNAPIANSPSGWVCITAGVAVSANFLPFGQTNLLNQQTTTATSGTLSSAFSSIILNPASTGTYSLPNVTAYGAGSSLFLKNIASGSVTLTPLAANNYEATSIAAITLAQNAAVTLRSMGTTTWLKMA